MTAKPLNPSPRTAKPRSRILICPPTPADRTAFLDLMRASRPLHRGWVSPPRTEAQYDAWLERLQTNRHRGFLVRRREDHAIVGVINVNEIIRGCAQSAFLGWYAIAPYAGQGYMTEGLHRVLQNVFGRIRLHRLEANIQPDNVRSIALAQRCGFSKEGFSRDYLRISGHWRDHERWAILATDWVKQQRRNRNQTRILLPADRTGEYR